MDDVKRWRMDAGYDAKLDEAGYWVRHDDYTALRARLEAVEKEWIRAEANADAYFELCRSTQARAERAESALATARRDALEEFVAACEERADMMEGVEMECCRGTAANCAADAEALISQKAET